MNLKNLVITVLLAGLLGACASEKTKEAVTEPTAAPTPAATGSADAASTSTAAVAPAPAAETAAMPDSNSVYFPFDVDAVQPSDRNIIQAHGAYLSKNSTAKVRVEGNCDERGSTEYNLGLGQRRANNVRKALILAGAKDGQIETVSYGEEKPRCAEHNEACWEQNRRADFIYK